MATMIELAIKISDEQQKLTIKHLLYEVDIMASKQDETLKELVKSALQDFKGKDPDVFITIKLRW